jgi:hypothetical protein
METIQIDGKREVIGKSADGVCTFEQAESTADGSFC